MGDLLAWRAKIGIVTPSVNTVTQPESDNLRPAGVTNHIARMFTPNEPMKSDADFNELVRRIDIALEDSVKSIMTCEPDHIILGVSAESIWGGGLEPSRKIAKRIKAIAGEKMTITQASESLPAALKAFGVKKRIGLISPYFEVAHKHLDQFVGEIGFELVRAKHLAAKGPVLIAHATAEDIRNALRYVNGDGSDVEAIIQFGANFPVQAIAAEAEGWLGKPVISVNTANYWYALRSMGIKDQKQGFGRLMAEH